MLDSTFSILHLPAALEEAGFTYGRACAHMLEPPRLAAYLQAMSAITGTHATDLPHFAARWAATLPAHYQLQMAAFAAGAHASLTDVQQWLYADIAAPSRRDVNALTHASTLINQSGPMCSGVVTFDESFNPWTARNCDWHEPTLSRGTCAVFHRAPHRIPCVAMGLMGDIDADTGMNAERLWLHMHTLLAHDEPRAGVSCISWLFWMREALETCSSLAELERFITTTDRDRGVMLFASDGKTGDAAIYECTRSTFRRIDPWTLASNRVLIATNHCQHKHPRDTDETGAPLPPRVSTSNGTVSRYNRLTQILSHAHPDHLPDDLCEVLADARVEMRTATPGSTLRTIYSAVADPARSQAWFASSACPAASMGTWRHLRLAW